MNNRLTTKDLAGILAEKTGRSSDSIELFLKEFITVVKDNVFADRLMQIKGIGTFKIIQVDSRESVDVNTKERIVIPAHYKLSFSPDKDLREMVNKPFSFFESIEINDDSDFTSFELPADDKEEEIEDSEETEIENDTEEVVAPVVPPQVVEPVRTKEVKEELTEEVKEEVKEVKVNIRDEIKKEEIKEIENIIEELSESKKEKEVEIEKPVEKEEQISVVVNPSRVEIPDYFSEKELEEVEDPIPEKIVASLAETKEEPVVYQEVKPETKQEPEEETIVIKKEETEEIERTKEKERTNILKDSDMNNNSENRRERDSYSSKTEYKNNNNTIVVILLAVIVILVIAVGSLLVLKRDVIFGGSNVASTQTSQNDTHNQITMPDDYDDVIDDEWGDGTEYVDDSSTTSTSEKENVIATIKTKKGDRLNLLALEYYGNKLFWVYIYEHNKSKLGNPDNIDIGLELDIPAKSLYGIDAGSPASIQKASVKQTQIMSKYKPQRKRSYRSSYSKNRYSDPYMYQYSTPSAPVGQYSDPYMYNQSTTNQYNDPYNTGTTNQYNNSSNQYNSDPFLDNSNTYNNLYDNNNQYNNNTQNSNDYDPFLY